MFIALVPGVDFTKHCPPSKKLPAHSVWFTISPPIKTLDFKLKLAHFLPYLFAICQTLCAKKGLILRVQKSRLHMLVKLTTNERLISQSVAKY